MLTLKCCDFQVHSPRDPKYKGWPEELMTLEGLEKWASALLRHCEATRIDCVAVTDHHDPIPSLVTMSVAHKTKSSIWVIPGIEVTSACGIQGILLLDPALFGEPGTIDFDSTEVIANKVLMTLGEDISAHKGVRSLKLTDWKTFAGLKNMPVNKRKDIFVSKAIDRIDKNFDGPDGLAANLERFFKDKYVLLPNLEKNSHGVFGNENGRALCIKGEGWFTGGVVGSGNPTNDQSVQGKDDGYGARVLSCLRTSDQRGQDATGWFGDRLGHPDCITWLKLSEPTTTSIAQALISGDGRRVFRSRPSEPGDRIVRVTLAGIEIFGDQTIDIVVSPSLNTFIGGRGSGKSLIISALVRLFGIDRDWAAKEERTMWEDRHLTLFSAGGPFSSADVSLSVEYWKESGVRFRLTMESPSQSLLPETRLEMRSGEAWDKVAEGDAVAAAIDFHPLFFLQGQMSSMTGSRLDQQDLIRLIEGPIRDLRQGLRNQLKELAAAARDGLQQKRRKLQHEATGRELDAQIKQKDEERKAFLAAAKKGLSDEQQKLFDEAETYRKGKTSAQSLEDGLAEISRSLETIITDFESSIRATSDAMKKLQESASGKFKEDAYLSKLMNSSGDFLRDLKVFQKQVNADTREIAEKRGRFLSHIDRLIGKASEVAEKERSRKAEMAKAANLEKEIEQLRKKRAAVGQDIQKIDRAGKVPVGEAALDKFKEVVKSYSKQLKERASAVSGNPDFRLVVQVIPGGMYRPFLEQMKSACQGCGVREKVWGELERVLQESADPALKITELLSTIIAAFGSEGTIPVPPVWSECGFSEAVFKNILQRTQLEHWLELSAILADDKVEVRYKRGGGKPPIPILSASPGERAVELLKLALFSTKGPIVIDQPEDELDNEFLAEKLVDLVQQSKHTNQLIFASHNANLVVHGDSELINVMAVQEVPPNKVGCGLTSSGTIDQQDICLAIERVLEGGRTAFEFRRRKYHETVDPKRTMP